MAPHGDDNPGSTPALVSVTISSINTTVGGGEPVYDKIYVHHPILITLFQNNS